MDPIASVIPSPSCDIIVQPGPAAEGRDLRGYLAACGVNQATVDSLSSDARAGAIANPAALGGHVLSGLEGFQGRVNTVSAMTDSVLSRNHRTELAQAQQALVGPAERHPGAAVSGADAAIQTQARLIDHSVESMMRLISDVFDFAIETQLVVKSATQLTGSVNTLLRGQ